MSEVTAQMIERGRKGDPAEASRRRRMNIKLKHARQTLTSYSGRYGRSLRQSGPALRAKREERDAGDRAF